MLESMGNACYSEIKSSPKMGLPFGDQVRDISCWSLWEMRVIVKANRLQRVYPLETKYEFTPAGVYMKCVL